MDTQVQCAVVTLVISNCLKKLSCPFGVLCIAAGKPVTRYGCRRLWIRRCIDVSMYLMGLMYICQETHVQSYLLVTAIITVGPCAALCCKLIRLWAVTETSDKSIS
jgi:hypothetical protein